MLRNPCDVMTAGIREMLACGFGKESVVDVLEGTKLEHYSKKLGFGLYVVKGAVEPSLQEVWANGCDRMFQAMAKQHGANSVEVRRRLPIYSDEKYAYFRELQAVVGKCGYTCRCRELENVAGNKYPLPHLDEGSDNGSCRVLMDSLGWLHNKLGIATDQGGFTSCQFNNAVAHQYKHGLDQYLPWNTDASEIFGPNPLIVSITLNSPGVFCFAPNIDMLLQEFSGPPNELIAFSNSLRACVALLSGDVIIMCGSFQKNMKQQDIAILSHKTSILEAFPAINPNLKKRLEQLVAEMPSLRKRKRTVCTFKRTVRPRVKDTDSHLHALRTTGTCEEILEPLGYPLAG